MQDRRARHSDCHHRRYGDVCRRTCRDAKDARALAVELEAVLRDGALANRLGREARLEYLNRYTPDANFGRLMEIYERARGGTGRVPAPLPVLESQPQA
jgi:hypothetical protein